MWSQFFLMWSLSTSCKWLSPCLRAVCTSGPAGAPAALQVKIVHPPAPALGFHISLCWENLYRDFSTPSDNKNIVVYPTVIDSFFIYPLPRYFSPLLPSGPPVLLTLNGLSLFIYLDKKPIFSCVFIYESPQHIPSSRRGINVVEGWQFRACRLSHSQWSFMLFKAQ